MTYSEGRWVIPRRARRRRRCDSCQEWIAAGATYYLWRYPPNWDGMGNTRWTDYFVHHAIGVACPDRVGFMA